MKSIKKFSSLLLVFVMIVLSFGACGKKETEVSQTTNETTKGSSSGSEAKDVETDTEAVNDSKEPQEIKVLRFGLNNPETHPLAQGVKEFARILNEKSDGALQVEFYFGGQLGDKKTQLQALRTGALDMYMIMAGNLVDYGADALKILPLPYLFDDVEHARAVEKSQIGQDLLDSIQSSGTNMIGIGYYQESARNFFFTDKAVTKVSDLDGLKIRVQTSQLNIKLMEAFGVAATPVDFGELYSALQTGVVDGAEQPYSGYYANKFHEICKYYVLDGHEISPNITLFSEIIWQTLSEEEQTMIIGAFNESVPYFEKISAESDEVIIAELKDQGVQILDFEEKDKLKELALPLYAEYGKGYEDIIQEIQNFK